MTKGKTEIIVSTAILVAFILIEFICVSFTARKYVAYINLPANEYQTVDVSIQGEGSCTVKELKREERLLILLLEHAQKGKFELVVKGHRMDDSTLTDSVTVGVTVSEHGLIFFGPDMDFRGHQIIEGLAALFFLYMGVLMYVAYRRYRKESAFSYSGLIRLGLSGYYLVQGFLLAGLCLGGVVFANRATAYQTLEIAGLIIALAIFPLLPLVILFSVNMTISNVALVRHEGFRFANVLGFIISALLMFGNVIIILSIIRTPLYLSANPGDVAMIVARTVSSSVFLYFVCILFATQLRLFSVAKREPELEQDFIIILGCSIRKDGTLYPLLQGRADRAFEFYQKQVAKTGKKAVFIPSGGQGEDEVISEGEAIKNYLVNRGIPEEQIIPETASRTTFENMKYSKRIIDERKKDAKVLFSTTNYHVFRSGMIAASAGLNADGIGSGTKWYFWPNAQVREFVGLLVARWKIHLIMCLLMIASAVPAACGPIILNMIVS